MGRVILTFGSLAYMVIALCIAIAYMRNHRDTNAKVVLFATFWPIYLLVSSIPNAVRRSKIKKLEKDIAYWENIQPYFSNYAVLEPIIDDLKLKLKELKK